MSGPCGRRSGPAPLSARELEVLQCVARGLSVKETAVELFLSPNTVKMHRQRIYAVLGVRNTVQAVGAAARAGLLPRAGVR